MKKSQKIFIILALSLIIAIVSVKDVSATSNLCEINAAINYSGTDYVSVCAFHSTCPQERLNAATVNVSTAGNYEVEAYVWYNSGDEQKNESYFLVVKNANGNKSYPLDANAGKYKVIADDPGDPHGATRKSGVFYFDQGINTIELHHYIQIASQYPAYVVAGPITGPESVKIKSLKIKCTVTDPCINNHKPVANAGSDQTVFLGDTVQFDGSLSSDADGDQLTFKWYLDNGAVLDGDKASYANFALGTRYVTLTVNDQCNLVQDYVLVHVNPKTINIVSDKLVSDNDEIKTHSNTSRPGEEIIYTLKIENKNSTAIKNIRLEDNYDQNYLIVLNPDGGSDNGDKISWQLGDLSSGAVVEKTVRMKIKDSITNNLNFKNYLSCQTDNAGSCANEVTTQVVLPNVPAELFISKSVSDNNESKVANNVAERNELLTYYLRAENRSQTTIKNLRIEDDYDQNYTEVISWETGGSHNGDKISWSLGDLAPYSAVEKTMIVRVKGDVADETNFKNFLRSYADNVSSQQKEVTTRIDVVNQDQVTLALDKTVSDSDETNKDYTSSHKNEVLTYRLDYHVNGRGIARNVVLRDDYDQRYVRIISTDGGSNNGNEIVWQLGNLESGYHTTRYVTVQIVNDFDNSLEISNWAYLRADNAPAVEDRVRTNIEGNIDNQNAYLNIVKTVFDNDENEVHRNSANVGEQLTYKIKISNNSTMVAQNVILTDDYDQNKIVIISFTGNANDNGDQLSWSIGNLDPGRTAERFITAKVKENLSGNPIVINNVAKVTGSNIQTMSDQTVTTVIAKPELNVTKTVSDNDEFDSHNNTAEPLETLLYTITVENTGLTTLENVVVIDNYDERYLKIISTDSGTDDGHVIRWQINSLKAGEQTTRVLTVQLNDQVRNGLNVLNRVTATANNVNPDNDSTLTSVYIPGVTITATSTTPYAPRTGAGLIFPALGGLSAGSLAGLSSFAYLKKKKKAKKNDNITTSIRFNPA